MIRYCWIHTIGFFFQSEKIEWKKCRNTLWVDHKNTLFHFKRFLIEYTFPTTTIPFEIWKESKNGKFQKKEKMKEINTRIRFIFFCLILSNSKRISYLQSSTQSAPLKTSWLLLSVRPIKLHRTKNNHTSQIPGKSAYKLFQQINDRHNTIEESSN